jgi:hypothetical protein
MPKSGTGFLENAATNNELEQNEDSEKRHFARVTGQL